MGSPACRVSNSSPKRGEKSCPVRSAGQKWGNTCFAHTYPHCMLSRDMIFTYAGGVVLMLDAHFVQFRPTATLCISPILCLSRQAIINVMRACAGLAPENHMLLEHRLASEIGARKMVRNSKDDRYLHSTLCSYKISHGPPSPSRCRPKLACNPLTVPC